MKIIEYHQASASHFESETAKGVTGRVLIGKQDGAPLFCMRHFEVAEAGYTPRHTHEWEHEIFFLSGEGEIYTNGKWSKVAKGTAAFIPGNEEHQIRNAGTSPLQFICLIPSGPPEL